MKIDQIKILADHELTDKMQDLRRKLFDLEFQKTSGKVEKPHLFRQMRKDIARILTVLRERKQDEQPKES